MRMLWGVSPYEGGLRHVWDKMACLVEQRAVALYHKITEIGLDWIFQEDVAMQHKSIFHEPRESCSKHI